MKITFEEKGKTIDEALKKVEDKFGVSKEKLKYEVIEENKGFIKSLFSRDNFIIRGEYEKYDNPKALAEKILKDILKHLNVHESTEINCIESERTFKFNISSAHTPHIIGKNGGTLDAITYILRHIVSKKCDFETLFKKKIVLDVDGYAEKRCQYINRMTNQMLKKVKATNSPVNLKPLSPKERKMVYKIVEKDRSLTAKSFGQGYYKRIAISIKNAKSQKNNQKYE